MQNLFDSVPEGLFGLLATKNKRLYFHALMVLRLCYQQELRIRRADLVAYLIHQMEDELYQWSLENDLDDDDEEEEGLEAGTGTGTGGGPVTTLSGRAHALIRRLVQTGWLEVMPDDHSLDELLLVPDYVILLLETFEQIVHPEEKKYSSYVYSTYSALKTAHGEREYMFQALQSAYDNTRALLESLKSLLHNIHKFYQNLQKQTEIGGLLAEHFDAYQVLVAAKTYHPLKTIDSVHRFRPRILDILRTWLTDEQVLTQMLIGRDVASNSGNDSASDVGQGAEKLRYEAIRMMQFVIDSFDSMDTLLREIDRRNTSYNRASVERIQYLLNRDGDLKGKLVSILRKVPKLEQTEPSKLVAALGNFPVFQVRAADPDALYIEKKRRARGVAQPLNLRETTSTALFAAEAQELMERAQSMLSDEQVIHFILRQMSADGVLDSKDLTLTNVEDYLRTLVAVIKSDESAFPFDLEWDEQSHTVMVNGYGIPVMRFIQTEVV